MAILGAATNGGSDSGPLALTATSGSKCNPAAGTGKSWGGWNGKERNGRVSGQGEQWVRGGPREHYSLPSPLLVTLVGYNMHSIGLAASVRRDLVRIGSLTN